MFTILLSLCISSNAFVFYLNCICVHMEGKKRGTCVFISLYAWFPLWLDVNPPLQRHWVWSSAPALSHAREEKEKADLAGLHLQRYPTGQLEVSQRWAKGWPSPWVSLQRPALLPQRFSHCIRPCQVTKISIPNATQIQSPTYSQLCRCIHVPFHSLKC